MSDLDNDALINETYAALNDAIMTSNAVDRHLSELRRIARAHPELGDEAVLVGWVLALVERVTALETRVLDLERIEHAE